MTYADRTLAEFVDAIAAGDPTPGGGSAAAVVGATGASLVEMVCNLTVGREAYADVEAELEDVRASMQETRGRLFELADEDSAAFETLMAAYRTSEAEGRAEAIQDATKHATEVPLETAEACLAVIEHAVPVARKGNENAVTDGGTGALLAHAALQAALYNVEINLGTIDDEEFVDETAARADEIEERAAEALDTVTETVDGKV
jgi:formiminotetrahydrofolate cyclodeaminase